MVSKVTAGLEIQADGLPAFKLPTGRKKWIDSLIIGGFKCDWLSPVRGCRM